MAVPKKQSVTLRDIARRCHVGSITVSYALRHDRGFVSQATIERINAVARRMKYDPAQGHAGRRLRYSRSATPVANQLAALFFPLRDMERRFWSLILKGIQQTLFADRYGMLACSVDLIEGAIADQLPQVFRRGEVDGTLIVPTEQYRETLVRVLRDEPGFDRKPIVTVLESLPGCSSVTIDDVEVGALAAGHLLDLGHRQILGFHSRRYTSPVVEERIRGYRRAFKDRGLDAEAGLTLENWIWEDGRNLDTEARELMARNPKATAILAPSDGFGVPLAKSLTALGVSIPGDVSMIGVDDTESWGRKDGENLWTTIRLPLVEVGALAAHLLLERIRGTAAEGAALRLKGELIARGSTSASARRGRFVRGAKM